MRGLSRVVLCCAALLGVLAAPAGAVIPEGNLLANPGAEDGPAASDYSGRFPPAGWQPEGVPLTAVRYGTLLFPTAADAAALGGGRNFFAGGPIAAGGPQYRSIIVQRVDVSAAAAEIDAGRVQATITACLGGYGSQDDYASIDALFHGRLCLEVPRLDLADAQLALAALAGFTR